MAQTGTGDDGDAIGEYCAEMTGDPVYMIRRGAYKYIHCDGDAPLLFFPISKMTHGNWHLAMTLPIMTCRQPLPKK